MGNVLHGLVCRWWQDNEVTMSFFKQRLHWWQFKWNHNKFYDVNFLSLFLMHGPCKIDCIDFLWTWLMQTLSLAKLLSFWYWINLHGSPNMVSFLFLTVKFWTQFSVFYSYCYCYSISIVQLIPWSDVATSTWEENMLQEEQRLIFYSRFYVTFTSHTYVTSVVSFHGAIFSNTSTFIAEEGQRTSLLIA